MTLGQYYCTHYPTHIYTHPGHYEEAQLPYYDAVPMDPSFDDMKKAVVIDKRRPVLPNQWSQSEVSSCSLCTCVSLGITRVVFLEMMEIHCVYSRSLLYSFL